MSKFPVFDSQNNSIVFLFFFSFADFFLQCWMLFLLKVWRVLLLLAVIISVMHIDSSSKFGLDFLHPLHFPPLFLLLLTINKQEHGCHSFTYSKWHKGLLSYSSWFLWSSNVMPLHHQITSRAHLPYFRVNKWSQSKCIWLFGWMFYCIILKIQLYVNTIRVLWLYVNHESKLSCALTSFFHP